MSEFRKWLTGAEMMKRLDISRLDLFELVQDGRLQAHDPDTGAKLEIGNRSLPLMPSDGFMGPSIKLTENGIKFLKPSRQEASPEELEKLCFLISEVEAIEKDRQKIKPQNEDTRVLVRSDTPFATVKEVRLILPYLQEALQRQMFKPLSPWAENNDFLKKIFAPPASHEEEVIKTLADIFVALINDPINRIEPIVSEVLPEIDEAYTVVKQDGGGWSSRKGRPEQRQAAVLTWFDQNEARLSCLKKSHLEDPTLYNPGSGQEKRNFYTRLVGKIVEEKAHQKITSQEIIDCLRRLKKSKKDLSGESLLRDIYAIANP